MNKPTKPQLPGYLNAHMLKQPDCQQPRQPAVKQSKGIVLQPKAKPPVAPPAYRPQPLPKVLQAKTSNGKTATLKSTTKTVNPPTAPPVYRPQPIPKVLQRKTVATPPPRETASGLKPSSPTAPPVYRPQPTPRVLQRRAAGQLSGSSSGERPFASKPAPVCHHLSAQKASGAGAGNHPVQAKMVDSRPGVNSNARTARALFASPRVGKGVVQRMETIKYEKKKEEDPIEDKTNEEGTTVLGLITNEPSLSKEYLAEQARKIVPYKTLEQLSHATKFMLKDGVYLYLAWKEYQKSSNPQNKDMGAIMYTIRNQAQKDFWALIEGQTVEEMADKGAIYSPWVEASESGTGQRELKHNMAVNRVWFLGVIHSGRKITLVTLLNESSLTRGYSAHPNLQQGSKGVSALGREALAATSTHGGSSEMFYRPQLPREEAFKANYFMVKSTNLNTQEFLPTGQTQLATIDDITYPDDMTSQQAMEELQKRGVHVTQKTGHIGTVYGTASSMWESDKKEILGIAEKNKDHLASPGFLNEFGPHVRANKGQQWTDERLLKLFKKNFPEKFNNI